MAYILTKIRTRPNTSVAWDGDYVNDWPAPQNESEIEFISKTLNEDGTVETGVWKYTNQTAIENDSDEAMSAKVRQYQSDNGIIAKWKIVDEDTGNITSTSSNW